LDPHQALLVDLVSGGEHLVGGTDHLAIDLVGTLGELSELVQIVIRNRLALTQTFYPLQRAAEAVEDLRNGHVEGRAVIVPADNQAH